jgi:hypothetical protein
VKRYSAYGALALLIGAHGNAQSRSGIAAEVEPTLKAAIMAEVVALRALMPAGSTIR